jgi:hypothetical protein
MDQHRKPAKSKAVKVADVKQSPYWEAAEFIVDQLAYEDDKTFISQKIAEVVLKPLLIGYIGDELMAECKLPEKWFSQR